MKRRCSLALVAAVVASGVLAALAIGQVGSGAQSAMRHLADGSTRYRAVFIKPQRPAKEPLKPQITKASIMSLSAQEVALARQEAGATPPATPPTETPFSLTARQLYVPNRATVQMNASVYLRTDLEFLAFFGNGGLFLQLWNLTPGRGYLVDFRVEADLDRGEPKGAAFGVGSGGSLDPKFPMTGGTQHVTVYFVADASMAGANGYSWFGIYGLPNTDGKFFTWTLIAVDVTPQ